MPALSNTARIILVLAVVAAVIAVMVITGSVDDKAKPGGGGRVPVPTETASPALTGTP